MDARLIAFGEIEIEGRRYPHDVVIERGRVRKRSKAPSKAFRDQFGHTPLTAGEAIPWHGRRLIIGTGADGQLPVMDDVLVEAARRDIEVVAVPTKDACRLLRAIEMSRVNAILHVTC